MSLEQLIRLEEIIAVNTFGRLMTDFVTIELDDFDVLIYSFAQGLGNTAFFNLVGANMLLSLLSLSGSWLTIPMGWGGAQLVLGRGAAARRGS